MKERPGQDRLTYSITEVAEMLGISRSMAYEGVHRGEIPAVRIGRRVLVPKTASPSCSSSMLISALSSDEADSGCRQEEAET
jgi:excisionase family DNA binding protein